MTMIMRRRIGEATWEKPGPSRAGLRRLREIILGKLRAALERLAPMGFEDDAGFHYGAEPVRNLPSRQH